MVYFIQQGRKGPIKIGSAGNVSKRLHELRRLTGRLDLRLLASMTGSRTHERALHLRFLDDRLIGEWFRPSRALREFIAALPRREPHPPRLRDADPTIINHGAVRLTTWLFRTATSQEAFALTLTPPVEQSLVSKWCRGHTIPEAVTREQISMVTSGEVAWEAADRPSKHLSRDPRNWRDRRARTSRT